MDIASIATYLSIIGSIFNGTGIAYEHKKRMFGSQFTWVCSNTLWVWYYAPLNQPKELYTFAAFFITAAFSVIVLTYRSNKHGKNTESK